MGQIDGERSRKNTVQKIKMHRLQLETGRFVGGRVELVGDVDEGWPVVVVVGEGGRRG